MISREEVFAIYRIVLGRDPENDDALAYGMGHPDLASLIASMIQTNEFGARVARAAPPMKPAPAPAGNSSLYERHNGPLYRVPSDLEVTPTSLRRILLIGHCLLNEWSMALRDRGVECDHVTFNNATRLPDDPPRGAAEYDFQVVNIPLRSVVPEGTFLGLSYLDESRHRALLEGARERMVSRLKAIMHWNERHNLLTFVANFLVPQQDTTGRLQARCDPRNMVYLIEELNRALAEEVRGYKDAHLLDIDQISATYGRRYVQDDALWVTSHGGLLTDWDASFDYLRLEPPRLASESYQSTKDEFIEAIWSEAIAMYRTLRQIDMVKLVAIDLDDTLWRGVVAETGNIGEETTEGWPLGIIEALNILKKRGIMLAIVSKNEESRVTALWDSILLGRLHLEDFAARRINWRPKAENLEEIIGEVNILPRNVVFVDDNPVERAAVRAALPEVRVLGSDLYYLRRILLWSPETQVASISAESARRTEMIQSQAVREASRKSMSREEFLTSLEVQLTMHRISSTDDGRYPRASELLNKTNQFNTTGKRWTNAEIEAAFAEGASLYTFDVKDRYTQYGLVGVIVVAGTRIMQFVMSCRVIGLDVEIAALAEVCRSLEADGADSVVGEFRETDANFLCRDLFERCGWRRFGDAWRNELRAGSPSPSHVTVTV